MNKEQALEICETAFEELIKRRVVGGDYEEQALEFIRAALQPPASEPPQPDVSELLEALKDASAELNRRNRYDVQYETTRVLANVGFVIKRAEQKDGV